LEQTRYRSYILHDTYEEEECRIVTILGHKPDENETENSENESHVQRVIEEEYRPNLIEKLLSGPHQTQRYTPVHEPMDDNHPTGTQQSQTIYDIFRG
jgi:hypothetical protein